MAETSPIVSNNIANRIAAYTRFAGRGRSLPDGGRQPRQLWGG